MARATSEHSPVLFDNAFVRSLPGDRSFDRSPRTVHGVCFASIAPERVRAPKLVAHAPEVADLLGLPLELVTSAPFIEALAGNTLLPGMEPYAASYGGHQFGSWAGQLGDGRAITLGELVGPLGTRFEVQLKGAGRTPYSRAGDGRAALRSSLREFLASEALHHLGIPTTRALSLLTTGEAVVRDMLYDGHPREEPGAIVCRVAPSFVRFGSFELFTSRSELDVLKQLADFVVRAHFPELAYRGSKVDGYIGLFHEACRRTAVLVAHWMRVGFVHGVLNTDNMSILGLTIDYGPYGFLDHYDREFTPNTSDASGRYRYAGQPGIAKWNLLKLAESLFPLIGSVKPLMAGLALFDSTFATEHQRMFADKLGLTPSASDEDASNPLGIPMLLEDLRALLALTETDFTTFFRALSDVPLADDSAPEGLLAPLAPAYYAKASEHAEAATLDWLRRYTQRARADAHTPCTRQASMLAANPRYVLRNYQAQLAIDAAEQGDHAPLHELLDVLRRPYDDQPGREHYAEKRPDWARDRAGCSQLSCSS